MNQEPLHSGLQELRKFYDSGKTKSYDFRIQQLKKFKTAILKYEKSIYEALYTDLKKSPEESYASELGLLIAEVNLTIKNLRSWMAPRPAGTDFVNLPSSSTIYIDPLGVVLIISPWNYPLQLIMIPLVGAIAGGNCVMLKPSEYTPATSAIVEKIVKEVFEENYVHIIQGDGEVIVPAMLKSFRFDHIFFTGSIPVGKAIYRLAAEQLVPVTLELGGKSPAIVDRDADLSSAARRIILGKFLNAGQTCIAPDYLLVHRDVKEKFVDKLRDTINKFYTKNPLESGDYGKIINERRFEKLISYVQQGTIVAGGKHDRTRLYIEPTIIEGVLPEAGVMSEEIFGPVLPLITFGSNEEAISVVKKNPNPLAFYLFTNNKKTEAEWIQKVSFGGGCINNADWHFTNHHLPFGGVGNSGMGKYHGKFTFETFTRMKPVMKTPTWFDPLLKYPPFKGKLKLFKWFIR